MHSLKHSINFIWTICSSVRVNQSAYSLLKPRSCVIRLDDKVPRLPYAKRVLFSDGFERVGEDDAKLLGLRFSFVAREHFCFSSKAECPSAGFNTLSCLDGAPYMLTCKLARGAGRSHGVGALRWFSDWVSVYDHIFFILFQDFIYQSEEISRYNRYDVGQERGKGAGKLQSICVTAKLSLLVCFHITAVA